MNLKLLNLPVPRTTKARSRLGKWFEQGPSMEEHGEPVAKYPWHKVLWLTGVDYFSTLGYQPGIALLAAGALAPIATLILVAVTLICAVPTYFQVAKRSYAGQGSLAILENQFSGWKSKILVLVLLGFAFTDFTITMTLSAADAAKHLAENPYAHQYFSGAELPLSILLLLFLALLFLKGFREAIHVAMAIAIPYIGLSIMVIVRGFFEVLQKPELWTNWKLLLTADSHWGGLFLASALIFPKLALGLSGFETGVTVMPLIQGERIKATRKLLLTAALIMSFMLLASSLVTTLLIPPEIYAPNGPAAGRALAYLAHLFLGDILGSIYDLFTILILWFAGASAMAGLLNLIPRYLPGFGMAPGWTQHTRPLVLLLFGINILITCLFRASVEAQAGAYATGVLVLMFSASLAVALSHWREASATLVFLKILKGKIVATLFWVVTFIFGFTLIDNVISRPDGVWIATAFIFCILTFAGISRYLRSRELRVADISLTDEHSSELWPKITGKQVNLVPLRSNTHEARQKKEMEIRKYYKASGPIAFLHISLSDNRSEFLASLRVKVTSENENYILEVFGAVAIANTTAYISELLDPTTLFLGLTRKNLMAQAFHYLLWGEGETGIMVYTILIRYWEWTPEDDVRPVIFLMSE